MREYLSKSAARFPGRALKSALQWTATHPALDCTTLWPSRFIVTELHHRGLCVLCQLALSFPFEARYMKNELTLVSRLQVNGCVYKQRLSDRVHSCTRKHPCTSQQIAIMVAKASATLVFVLLSLLASHGKSSKGGWQCMCVHQQAMQDFPQVPNQHAHHLHAEEVSLQIF